MDGAGHELLSGAALASDHDGRRASERHPCDHSPQPMDRRRVPPDGGIASERTGIRIGTESTFHLAQGRLFDQELIGSELHRTLDNINAAVERGHHEDRQEGMRRADGRQNFQAQPVAVAAEHDVEDDDDSASKMLESAEHRLRCVSAAPVLCRFEVKDERRVLVPQAPYSASRMPRFSGRHH